MGEWIAAIIILSIGAVLFIMVDWPDTMPTIPPPPPKD